MSGRSVWRLLFQNIKKSFNLLPPKRRFVGEDDVGNKYFEAVEGHNFTRKHPFRWFEPKTGVWQPEENIPPEWEAWLRNRRNVPPTVEEIYKNTAIAQVKKVKGDEIRLKSEKERGITSDSEPTNPLAKGFPTLKGLEIDPGSSYEEKKS